MLGLIRRLLGGPDRRHEDTDFLTADIADPANAEVVVTLDGLLVPYCVAADADSGWVDVWRCDRLGRPINALGWPVKDRHYGRVAIRFRDDRARLAWQDRREGCDCQDGEGE
jgi:hypothetical protein